MHSRVAPSLPIILLALGCRAAPVPSPRTLVAAPPPAVSSPQVPTDASLDGSVPLSPGDASLDAADPDAVSAAFSSPTPPTLPGSSEVASVGSERMFRGRSEDEWLRLMATRPVVRMIERFSSTAMVYHFDLGDGIEISFKPERPGQEPFWRHEVIAYRFARLINLPNRVPPVVGRRLPIAVFGRYRGINLLVRERDRTVAGAAGVWMPVLRNSGLQTPEARREWIPWLDPARPPPPAARSERARQISEILLLDYIQSNYDRWNCCNIPLDERGDLVIRDNDGGWYHRPLALLGLSPSMIHRIPRSEYEGLQRATPEALVAEVNRDPLSAEGMLDRAQLESYERRRQSALRRVRTLIQRHGESQILVWP